jgi:hypothetical protein
MRSAPIEGRRAEEQESDQELVLSKSRRGPTQANCKRHAIGLSREAVAPYPASPEPPSVALAALSARGIRERDDAYPHIVRAGDLRVIECRDALQWILQRRRKSGRWIDLGYFRNRDVLIERSGLNLAALRSLPPYHLGREGSAP